MAHVERHWYAGAQMRLLRTQRNLNQGQMAKLLGISVSYLSQIEGGKRPLTRGVLNALADSFPDEWNIVEPQDSAAMQVLAINAAGDPSIDHALPNELFWHRIIGQHPPLARRLVALHDAVQHGQNQLYALDDRVEGGTMNGEPLPWEEVRDWFHNQRNYIDAIDRQAEQIGATIMQGAPAVQLEARLRERHGIGVAATEFGDQAVRVFDAATKTIYLDASQPPETTTFSLAYQLARLEFVELIQSIAYAGIASDAARQLLSAGLANYAAGAILMPYTHFRATAREVRHDIDRLRQRFGTSFEQTCHRLSTLQRPGALGVPFFFCRIDMAGNITKRHSATRLQFARFGGNCPLWIVHEAVAIPDRILQLAETPDGVRYVSMAKGLVKPSGSYARPPRRYAVALGCEVEHAHEFIYADGLQQDGPATPIGISCRICPRSDCEQRAFPPAASNILIDHDRRGTVPYRFSAG